MTKANNHTQEKLTHDLIIISKIKELMTPRIKAMQRVTQELNESGVRKTLLYTNMAESLKQTTGEDPRIRRAKAFAYHLEHIDMPIYPAEQLAGSITGMWPVDKTRNISHAELKKEAVSVIEHYRDNKQKNIKEKMTFGTPFEDFVYETDWRFAIMARDHYDANTDYRQLQKVIKDLATEYETAEDIESYEIARELERYFQYDYGQEVKDLFRETNWNVANHTNLNYKDIVKNGLGAILDRVEAYLLTEQGEDKKAFYTSVIIAMNATISFIERYSIELEKSSENDSLNTERRAELAELARICKKISKDAPDTFFEALQLVWMVHLIANLNGGSALSFARFDQYMYPFFENDIENGSLTEERARELISCLYLKMNEPKMRTVQSLCVGGVDPQTGESSANALSQICLDIMSMLKLPYPNMSVRIDPEQSPEWLLDESIRTVKAGGGQPMLLNDQLWVKNLHESGIPIEAARDYYNMGCTEIMIQGKEDNWKTAGILLLPQYVLDTMEKSYSNERTFSSFDEFLEAYLDVLKNEIIEIGKLGAKDIEFTRKNCCDPFASAFIEGCIENGLDYFQGGTTLGTPMSLSGQGLGTAVDSLSAIKKIVFDEKKLSLDQLYEITKNNFKGSGLLISQIENYVPAYGNDDKYADGIAQKIFGVYCASVRHLNKKAPEKTRFVMNVFSYNMHISLGEVTAATPNGRLKGEPFSDCVGPTQGKDSNGPTAFLNSILSMDFKNVNGAFALNFKISPSLVTDEEGTQALKTLLMAYFHDDGPQIQMNYVDANVLRAAQREPEKHKDIVVRIAGYCEHFINLDYKLQNEIIERTMHEIL